MYAIIQCWKHSKLLTLCVIGFQSLSSGDEFRDHLYLIQWWLYQRKDVRFTQKESKCVMFVCMCMSLKKRIDLWHKMLMHSIKHLLSWWISIDASLQFKIEEPLELDKYNFILILKENSSRWKLVGPTSLKCLQYLRKESMSILAKFTFRIGKHMIKYT